MPRRQRLSGAAAPLTRARIDRTRKGFTLVEVIIALALSALIGVAGFSMLSGVLQTQDRTDGRLRRLSEVQRAMFVVNADLDQLSGQIDGGPDVLVFQKTDLSGRPVVVRYDLRGGGMVRTVSGPLGERSQPILSGVTALAWTYRLPGAGWVDEARPTDPTAPAAPPTIEAAFPDVPAAVVVRSITAVALDVGLTGIDGRPTTLRRVVAVPEIKP